MQEELIFLLVVIIILLAMITWLLINIERRFKEADVNLIMMKFVKKEEAEEDE